MSSKKKLKTKINKLRIKNRLMRSDLLIENQNLSYRIVFAESQVSSLIKENQIMREKLNAQEKENAGNGRETANASEIPCSGTLLDGVAINAGNPPSP